MKEIKTITTTTTTTTTTTNLAKIVEKHKFMLGWEHKF